MRPARGAAAALVALGAAALVGIGPAVTAQPSGDADELLAAMRTANAHQSYTGSLVVEWRHGGHLQRLETSTRVSDGVVEVGAGSEQALSRDGERFVGSPGNWTLVLGPNPSAAAEPAADAHWDLSTTRGPTVAGRSTVAVVASDPGTRATRARFDIDPATGTLLRRDVLDADGALVRSVAFEAVVPLGAGAVPPRPPAKDVEPDVVTGVAAPYLAPRALGPGFQRLDEYRQPDGTVQLDYGDGVFTLSLFEQRGRIDRGALPPGPATRVGGATARTYETPTTSVVVWTTGGLVLTCVSDAPPDRVLTAARAVGTPAGSSTLHGIAHFILGPFGWD